MCIPLSRSWASNVHRKKYHINTVLLFKGTSIPSLFRTVLLKGHLFLLCFFVRDKCLFSLFCNLDFVRRPLFFCHSLFLRRSLFFRRLLFSVAHFFFRRSLFFRLFTIFFRRSLVSTPHFSVYVLSSVPKYFGRELKAKHCC